MRKNTLASYENLVCMTLEDEQIFQKITSDPIYDTLDRPIQAQYIDATVTYQYDAAGRKTRVDDTQFGGTFVTWTYDNANRVLSEASQQGMITYIYNSADELISMKASDRPIVNYSYDNVGRLSTISQNLGQGLETFTYFYDILSRRVGLDRPNSITSSYEYDQADRLTRLKHQKANSSVVEDFQYTFNSDNEKSSISSLFSMPATATGQSVSIADNNNRISKFGDSTFSFNALGKTISRLIPGIGNTVFDWDHRGRLIKVTLPNAQEVTYKYDSANRRISRNESNNTVEFLYDGLDIVLDTSSDGRKVDYINNPLNTDEKLRQFSNLTGSLYFIQNQLNSTIALTNINSNVIERIQYDSFGKNNNSMLTRYLYTGREFDNSTMLTYYRMRWYDHTQGRFLSEDPIGFTGSINFYVYTSNNPVSFTDPLGLQRIPPIPPLPQQKPNGIQREDPSTNKNYNCLASGLGYTSESIGLGNKTFNIPSTIKSWQIPSYFLGCVPDPTCNKDCNCGKTGEPMYKLKFYWDYTDPRQNAGVWHVFRKKCDESTWTSKNYHGGPYYDGIYDTDQFFKDHFDLLGPWYSNGIAGTYCWCCPDKPKRIERAK